MTLPEMTPGECTAAPWAPESATARPAPARTRPPVAAAAATTFLIIIPPCWQKRSRVADRITCNEEGVMELRAYEHIHPSQSFPHGQSISRVNACRRTSARVDEPVKYPHTELQPIHR